MKTIFLSVWVVLAISACAPQVPPCPWLGLDVRNPDFFMQASPATVDALYSCELQRSRGYDEQTDLHYQWNLWRRIIGREISPAMAQQLWIEFSTQHYYQQAQLREMESTGAALRYQSHQRSYGRPSYRREGSREHHREREPRQRVPEVPAITLPSLTIPGIPESRVTPATPTGLSGVPSQPVAPSEPALAVGTLPAVPAPERPMPEAPASAAPEPTPEPKAEPEPQL